MRKNKYISFSLWGDKPIFNIGILKNIELAKEIYPEWKVIVYYDNSIPKEILDKIIKMGAIAVDSTGVKYGPFWRFFAADLPDCEFAIFRDGDSRLSLREKEAVDAWVNSGKTIHIMRDHPLHEIPVGTNSLSILAGMWGIKGNIVEMRKEIEVYVSGHAFEYGVDQTFLKSIYDRFKNNSKVHDEFFSNAPFPSNRVGYTFIGERIDENDKPLGNDREALKEYYRNKLSKKTSLFRSIKSLFSKFTLK